MPSPPTPFVQLTDLLGLRTAAQKLSLRRLKRNRSLLTGQFHSNAVSRGMEFSEVRLYNPGDDVRNIDWRVTARTRETHTKCYQEEREKPIVTLLDQRSSLFFGSSCFKSVYAAQTCALINWAALRQGDRTGGIVASHQHIEQVSPSLNSRGVTRWLQRIVEANQTLNSPIKSDQEPSLNDMLLQLKSASTPGHELFIISDFHDFNEDCQALLFQLARHCIVTLIWLVDPLDYQLPKKDLSISDGKHSALHPFSSSTWEQYHQQFVEREQRLYQLSEQSPIRIVLAETNKSTPIQLMRGLYS